MYEILCMLGPGAIAYYIVNLLSKSKEETLFESFVEYIIYTTINVLFVVLVLMPIKKIEFIQTESHVVLHYGGIAFVASVCFAVVEGLVLAMIKKNVNVTLFIETESKRVKNEKK